MNSDFMRKKSANTIMVGIVRPISSVEGNDRYSKEHWLKIEKFINNSIKNLNNDNSNNLTINCKLVSNSDQSHIIHKTIVNNIYNNDLIICDVSSKNSNVMFELGLRIAFGKPVILIKDEITDYSFDTSGIEHVPYDSGFEFDKMQRFMDALANKVLETYYHSTSDAYEPFIKTYGSFELVGINDGKFNLYDFLTSRFDDINKKIELLQIYDESSKESTCKSLIDSFINRENISSNSIIGNISRIVDHVVNSESFKQYINDKEKDSQYIAKLVLDKI